MSGTRQNIQYALALAPKGRDEAPVRGLQGTEPPVAKPIPESPACEEQLMEEGCARGNLVRAWKRVRSNKGGPGADGMTIEDAKAHLREHWPNIRSQLLSGTYQPQPVKRVEIPKPDGRIRKLGVPCVVDRLIQQALLQVLQERWDPTFSEHSYGFRPGRSAHQAVAQAQRYVAEGYGVVVDLDLERFFDRVNHDSLGTLQRRGVHEDIPSTLIWSDKAKPLIGIVPFHRAQLFDGRAVARRICRSLRPRTPRRLLRRGAGIHADDLGHLRPLRSRADAHLKRRARRYAAVATTLRHAYMQEGIAGAICELHEAESLLGIVPFDGGADGWT